MKGTIKDTGTKRLASPSPFQIHGQNKCAGFVYSVWSRARTVVVPKPYQSGENVIMSAKKSVVLGITSKVSF